MPEQTIDLDFTATRAALLKRMGKPQSSADWRGWLDVALPLVKAKHAAEVEAFQQMPETAAVDVLHAHLVSGSSSVIAEIERVLGWLREEYQEAYGA